MYYYQRQRYQFVFSKYIITRMKSFGFVAERTSLSEASHNGLKILPKKVVVRYDEDFFIPESLEGKIVFIGFQTTRKSSIKQGVGKIEIDIELEDLRNLYVYEDKI